MRSRPWPSLVPLMVALTVLVALVAIPALAASPSPTPTTSTAASAKPERSDKPGKGPKAKTPAVETMLSGTVEARTDAQGQTEYTLSVGSTTYTIDAGPSWYWKDKHPLKAYVGKRVTIVGEQKQGSTEVDVRTVDGQAVREPGKPPWAGGWKVVGKDHPGWSQEKADRQAARQAEKMKRFGLGCWPPGHCKDASGKPATPNADPTSAP